MKKDNYVIQRYVINPEARNIADKTIVSIHRQTPNDPNMDWFNENDFDKAKTQSIQARQTSHRTYF